MRTSSPTNFTAASLPSFVNGSRVVSLRPTQEHKYLFEPFITINQFQTATKWHYGIRFFYIEISRMLQDFAGTPMTGTAYWPMVGPAWSANSELFNAQSTTTMPFEKNTNLILSSEWFWAQPNYSVAKFLPDCTQPADGSIYTGLIRTNGLTPRMYLDERFPGTNITDRVIALVKDCIVNERVIFEKASTDAGATNFTLSWPLSGTAALVRSCQHTVANCDEGRAWFAYTQYPRGCDFGWFRNVLQGVLNDWMDNWTRTQDGALAPSGARSLPHSGSTDLFILFLNIQNYIWVSDSRCEWYSYATQPSWDGIQYSSVHATGAPQFNLD